MSSDQDQQPPVQFSVAGLLAVCAGIAAAFGICLTLVELENASGTHSGWTSEVRTIDGTPDVVMVPVRISTDTGRIISSSYLGSLYVALVLEMVTLVAVAFYLVRRSRRKRAGYRLRVINGKKESRTGREDLRA